MTLSLTPFEEYMLVDTQPGFPMSCFILLEFRGGCDRNALEEAFNTSLYNHPFLRSIIREKKRNYYVWEELENPVIFRSLDDQSDAIKPTVEDKFFHPSFRVSGLDIMHRPGIQVTHWTSLDTDGTAKTWLFLEMHHTASDAEGEFHFLEDAFLEYLIKKGICDASVRRKYRMELLESRDYMGRWYPGLYWQILGDFLLFRWSKKRCGKNLTNRVKYLYYAFQRARYFLFNRVRPFLPAVKGSAEHQPPETYPALTGCFLNAEETLQLRRTVKSHGVSMNDYLVMVSFLAMKECLEMPEFQNDKKLRGFLRVAVPMNMRSPDMEDMPAANLVSMVFLDRHPAQIRNSVTFLKKIHREMDILKRYDLGLAFIHGVKFFKKCMGSVRMMCGSSKCWTSITVSNHGVMWKDTVLPKKDGRIQIGEMELENLYTMPPIRNQTVLGISVMTYAESLKFTMQYDTQVLSLAQANLFLNQVLSHLRKTEISQPT